MSEFLPRNIDFNRAKCLRGKNSNRATFPYLCFRRLRSKITPPFVGSGHSHERSGLTARTVHNLVQRMLRG